MEQPNKVHQFHRGRLKQRFVQEGMNGFEDHNVLELLLFYALPKGDTNPLAHALMERYGTLAAVFDAPYEDLLTIKGVGAHTALLLKLIPELSRRYCIDRFSGGKTLPEHSEVGTYLVTHFLGEREESVFAMFYDSSLRLLDRKCVHRGSVNAASFSLRSLAQPILVSGAAYVILAHNHPKGLPIASEADLDTTRRVRQFCAELGVNLIEHFIVAEDHYVGLCEGVFREIRARILPTEKPQKRKKIKNA